MKRILSVTVVCLFSAFFHVQAASVWRVTNGDNTVYLGGTLHILSPDDYPLPAAYDTAYADADTLVFETDLGALNTPEFMRQTLALMMYQDERTIKDDLSDETYQQLSRYLASRQIPIQQVSKMKPAMLGISLSMLEMHRVGLTSQGVDNFFYAKAMEDQKQIDWFETPKEQLEIISRLGEGDEDAYIKYSLDELNTMTDLLDPLKTFWREGDMKGLYDVSMIEFKTEYPDVYDDVLTNRNQNWLPKIVAYLSSSQTEFVLVGTMHMAGEEGVIALLEKAGYTVTPVRP
nr:TraB/GumN family protein [Alteromonas sp. C1M14]